jgi:hypothetical protein
MPLQNKNSPRESTSPFHFHQPEFLLESPEKVDSGVRLLPFTRNHPEVWDEIDDFGICVAGLHDDHSWDDVRRLCPCVRAVRCTIAFWYRSSKPAMDFVSNRLSTPTPTPGNSSRSNPSNWSRKSRARYEASAPVRGFSFREPYRTSAAAPAAARECTRGRFPAG